MYSHHNTSRKARGYLGGTTGGQPRLVGGSGIPMAPRGSPLACALSAQCSPETLRTQEPERRDGGCGLDEPPVTTSAHARNTVTATGPGRGRGQHRTAQRTDLAGEDRSSFGNRKGGAEDCRGGGGQPKNCEFATRGEVVERARGQRRRGL